MQRKSITTALIAAAFALPLVATAGGVDKTKGAKTASATNDVSAEAFRSADKNFDGFISMEEAKGSPYAANFASLDKDGDGKLSQTEYDNSKDQVAGQSSTSITTPSVTTSTPSPTTSTPSTTTSTATDSSVAKKN